MTDKWMDRWTDRKTIHNSLFSFTDTVTISSSVTMESFYKHIIRHCSEYDIQTLELVQSSRDGSGLSPTLWDISLMIDLAPSVIGPMTTPELSRILHDTRELYHVIILAIPIVPVEDDHTHQSFSFTLYMLLVNKNEVFPHLTVNTPFLSHHLGMSRSDKGRPENETMSQSQLHVSVRNHRRKLGYGSGGAAPVTTIGVVATTACIL